MTEFQIKAAVRKRDGMRCTDCGMTNDRHIQLLGSSLQVHRLKPSTEYSIEGCVTLCAWCHGPKPKFGQRFRVTGDEPTSPRESFHLPAELRTVLAMFVDTSNLRTSKSAVMVAALEEYFAKRNLWPPPAPRP
jgi:hypothetical protein